MYGLINSALKEFIIKEQGEVTWQDYCTELEGIPESYDNLTQYDDKIITTLVTKVSENTNIKIEDLLIEFGKYWISYAKDSEYQGILETFSTNPIELISSLDALHTRLSLSFENLEPPSFWVTKKGSKSLLVHYNSGRELPLEYFVKGLIFGIFEMFESECEVEIIQLRTKEKEAIFKVSLLD